MATGSNDRTVRIWNIKKLNDPPIVLSDHKDWVWAVTFTPDNQQLMVGLQHRTPGVRETDESIHAWPTNPERMAGLLCGYTDRNMTDEEWSTFVGDDLDYEKTCENIPDR